MGRRSGPSDRYEPDSQPVTHHYRYATTVVVLAIVAVLGVAVVGTIDGDAVGSNEFDQTTAETAAIERINEAREANGLSPLRQSDEIAARARAYSTELAAAGELEHGTVVCRPGAENIAQTYYQQPVETDSGTKTHSTSTEVGAALGEQWLGSKLHRENIMSPRFTTVAVGVVEKDGVVYATQRFCG